MLVMFGDAGVVQYENRNQPLLRSAVVCKDSFCFSAGNEKSPIFLKTVIDLWVRKTTFFYGLLVYTTY